MVTGLPYLERGKGIEPLTSAWKAEVIPFYEPRMFGCAGRNRTSISSL